MKKINFNIIKEEDLEKQYGYTVVNAPEGKVGPGTCDDDDISDVEEIDAVEKNNDNDLK